MAIRKRYALSGKWHRKCEPRFFSRRTGRQFTTVSLGDLRGDIEPQAEALPARARFSAEKGLEQLIHRAFRNWRASVGYPQLERTLACFGVDFHRLV